MVNTILASFKIPKEIRFLPLLEIIIFHPSSRSFEGQGHCSLCTRGKTEGHVQAGPDLVLLHHSEGLSWYAPGFSSTNIRNTEEAI